MNHRTNYVIIIINNKSIKSGQRLEAKFAQVKGARKATSAQGKCVRLLP